jgi:ribonuclease P/MRP protein subunit POP5
MILPSSKRPKRYVYFEVVSDKKVFKEETNLVIYKTCLDFLGEKDYGQANIMIVKNNIIRVEAKYKDELIFALSLIREINKKKVMLNTLRTSGSIKKVKRS